VGGNKLYENKDIKILIVAYFNPVPRALEHLFVVLEWFLYTSASRRGTGEAMETNERRAVQQYGVAEDMFLLTCLMLAFCISNEVAGKLCGGNLY
jgi:hypothetical protein